MEHERFTNEEVAALHNYRWQRFPTFGHVTITTVKVRVNALPMPDDPISKSPRTIPIRSTTS